MYKITTVIVWFNESLNLHKLFRSLQEVADVLLMRKIYIDQTSTDDSAKIAKKYWCEIYIHENKWYADPDKKRAVDTLCQDNERILILDADEKITLSLANEIVSILDSDIEVANILVRSIIFGGFGWEAYQPRLFKKNAVLITDEIHNYIKIISDKIKNLSSPIINDDLKYKWKEVQVFLEKLDRYSDKEIEYLSHYSKLYIIRNLFRKPIQRFFWFGVIHKQFFRWIKWLLLCSLMSYYQRSIYAKLYEKKYIK